MKVAMVGAGYVGLVSGACFAEFGADVTCIDIDSDKIGKLREGVVPIYEPGLAELINKNREQGRLAFRDGYDESIAECDLIFIAVGTPGPPWRRPCGFKIRVPGGERHRPVSRRLYGDSG